MLKFPSDLNPLPKKKKKNHLGNNYRVRILHRWVQPPYGSMSVRVSDYDNVIPIYILENQLKSRIIRVAKRRRL